VTHYAIHFGGDGGDVQSSWWDLYALKFFDREHVGPVEVDCVYNTWSFEVWDVAYVISVFRDFFATSMYIADVWVDADDVVSVNSHEYPYVSGAGMLRANRDVKCR
jgi:hypothetical protein